MSSEKEKDTLIYFYENIVAEYYLSFALTQKTFCF